MRRGQWAFNSDYIMQIAPHVQGRVETLSQIAPLAGFFFSGTVPLTAELFAHKKAQYGSGSSSIADYLMEA